MSTTEMPGSGTSADGRPAEVRELTTGSVVHGYPPRPEEETGRGPKPGAAVRAAEAGRSEEPSRSEEPGTGEPDGETAPAAPASPWQRSYSAWRRAGVDWQPVAPPAAPGRRTRKGRRLTRDAVAAATSATASATASAAATSGRVDAGSPAGETSIAAASATPGAPPVAAYTASSTPAPSSVESPVAASATIAPPPPDAPARRGETEHLEQADPLDSPDSYDTASGFDRRPLDLPAGRRRVGLVAAIVALAAIAGGGAYALVGGDQQGGAGGGATVGDAIFATDPSAATDGRAQDLRGVAAVGNTIVAVGSETGGDYFRGQFFVSQDGGRGWRLATVRTADGGEPPPGEFPDRVSAGPGRWTAIGGSGTRRVVWTSVDGATWTRQPDTAAAAFQSGDRINAISRADAGFVAVGTTERRGRTPARAAAWTSADGRAWERLPATAFKARGNGQPVSLERVTAQGVTVLALGTVGKAAEGADGGDQRSSRRTGREAVWRSADGGRTWTQVTVPQDQGSAGRVTDIVAGPGGFFAAREAKGKQGRRGKAQRFGLILRSSDGVRWTSVGQVRVDGYTAIDRLVGSSTGLAALATVRDGRTLVFRSQDGAAWRPGGEIERGRRRSLSGAAVTPGVTVVVGRQGSGETAGAYLAAVGGAGPVDLARVADAVHAERRVTEVAAQGTRAVAVGSANGEAAAWISQDGSTWSRCPAFGDAFGGTGQQRLYDVVQGGRGWLAVGVSSNGRRRPLVVTSSDGSQWRATGAGTFGRRGAGEQTTHGVTFGPRGYVVVGERVAKDRTNAAVWHSVDATKWSGPAAMKQPGSSMRDVASWTSGYAAVGTRLSGSKPRPAVWTSADGRRWSAALREPPLPAGAAEGGLDRIVARGRTLVAAGWALDPRGSGVAVSYLAVSGDGGKTWQLPAVPVGVPTGPVTSAAATDTGFTVSLVSSTPAGDRIALWTSGDGRTWRASQPGGNGLTGPGIHRLTGMTLYQGNLLAVGFTGDHRRDLPLLWHMPVPAP